MNANMMQYKGYSASIAYSEEDGVLVGRVPGIQDIIDFHGESVAEIRREFRNAIDEYVKACEKSGVTPDTPYPDSEPAPEPNPPKQRGRRTRRELAAFTPS